MTPDPFDPYPSLGEIRTNYAEYEHVAEEQSGRDIVDDQATRPLTSLYALALLAVLVLSIRLIDLQVIQGTKSRVLAEGNRIRTREIRAPRGEIVDRQGEVLAGNSPVYTLEIFPAELPRSTSEREQILEQVGQITSVDIEPFREKVVTQGLVGLNAIVLAEHIDRDQAIVWQARLDELPGVSLSRRPRRLYADIPGLGHILGYVGSVSDKDKEHWPNLSLAAAVGKSGLEVEYEESLQGVPGEERIEVDARGRVERVLQELSPSQGQTVELSLDARLQQSMANHLAEQAAKRTTTKAAAVALDPRNGGILAMVSLPSFDPNIFVDERRQSERQALLENKDQPLLNRVTNGTYPSGSTIKPVIAAAALGEETITAQTRLDTSAGVIQIGQWRFPDWKVHGVADVKRAIAESNDIFFYALGGGYEHIRGLGPERMGEWLEKFGFGGPTGVDLPSEAKGLVPGDAWKKERIGESWYIGDSYHMAIGQGYFLSTPLQLARATAAIANGGTLYAPRLVTKIGDDEREPSATETSVASAADLATVRDGMRLTITDGTARSLGELTVPVAGKTGTAQFGPDKKTHSWFVGYAPADNPEIAVAFLVEDGGESSDSAVPAAKAFLADWIQTRSETANP